MHLHVQLHRIITAVIIAGSLKVTVVVSNLLLYCTSQWMAVLQHRFIAHIARIMIGIICKYVMYDVYSVAKS